MCNVTQFRSIIYRCSRPNAILKKNVQPHSLFPFNKLLSNEYNQANIVVKNENLYKHSCHYEKDINKLIKR